MWPWANLPPSLCSVPSVCSVDLVLGYALCEHRGTHLVPSSRTRSLLHQDSLKLGALNHHRAQSWFMRAAQEGLPLTPLADREGGPTGEGVEEQPEN